MAFAHPEMNLTDPTKGFNHFVLYTEARVGVAGAAWNATVKAERSTPYFEEWRARLQRCDPSPLHTTLVSTRDMPKLFHPCGDDDPNSPSARYDGCSCLRTFVDLEFGLPVVARHFRSVRGTNEQWTYTMYAPLDLRPGDVVQSVVFDRGDLFWARTTKGLLSVLPMLSSRGYGAGPHAGTGGATTLAAYLKQLVDTDGREADARYRDDQYDLELVHWLRSEALRGRELTLREIAAVTS